MYKLSPDIMISLKKQFPDSNIEAIVQYLIMSIIQKTLSDGSCHIREFGKFVAFGSISTKCNKKVIRFKFKPSVTLIEKFNMDQYLIESIPVKAKLEFNESHEEKCRDKQDIKKSNLIAQNEAEKLGYNKTLQNLNKHEILDILNNNDN